MLTIRQLELKEIVFPIELAAKEGWNPGLYDGISLYRTDPGSFFLAELDGGMVGCIWALRYGPQYGFIGGQIVLPPFRGKGIGEFLWQNAITYLQGRIIGTDGLLESDQFYKRFGFISEHKVVRYGGAIFDDACLTYNIYPIQEVSEAAIIDYDERMFSFRRLAFLRSWLEQPGAESACYIINGQIRGFGMIRASRQGYRLGPLYADQSDIAEKLLRHLACKAGDNLIYLDIPESNEAALEFVRKYKMKPVLTRMRSYTGQGVELPISQTFALTGLDIG